MRRDNWIVGDYAIRPISQDENVCTYCREPRGNTHKPDCVIRTRSVVVRLEVEYVKLVPESFDEDMVNFIANEGTRCIDMSIHELHERSMRWEEPGGNESPDGKTASISCFCGHAKEHYVREATERDERIHGVFVTEAES